MTTEITINKDGDVTIKTEGNIKVEDKKKEETKESTSTNTTKILLTE